MEKYTCEICGKNHTVYRSVDVPLPKLISEMSEEERSVRVRKHEEFYYVDDDILFVNGWINVEAENHPFPFYYWKTWASISKKELVNSREVATSGNVASFDGKLETDIPFYDNSFGLKTNTLIQLTNDELIVEIQVVEQSKLKEDQSKPISEIRMIEIMQMLHHNPKREELRNFDQPFNERLIRELEKVEDEYIKEKKNFGININGNAILFQIISNKLIESPKIENRGFALHLSFDESVEESEDEISNFRAEEYSSEFDYLVLDNIPTYQIDLGLDKNRLLQLVISIVADVYRENLETIEVSHFEI